MGEISPVSPEARRKQLAGLEAAFGHAAAKRLEHRANLFEIVKRIGLGVYNDGFIHAGNLAFLALLALFPFFIVAAALTELLGQTGSSLLAVNAILAQLPRGVAETLRGPIEQALNARTGPLLWFGALVGIWTAGSFIETIRDILRRAYGVKYSASFWQYRLASIAIVVGSVFLLMIAFTLTLVLRSAQAAIEAWLPFAQDVADTLGLIRIIPGIALYGTIYLLFLILTPARYRRRGCRKWPGALLITLWWMAIVEVLPGAIGLFGGYDLTYGSMAGFMVVLIFFYLVGLGLVSGAELNAALAEARPTALKGEIYTGPYSSELEVEEPQPGEDIERMPAAGGPQL
jgi:membrane protein